MTAVDAYLRTASEMAEALTAAGVGSGRVEDGLVFQLEPPGDEWAEVMGELRLAFELSRAAAQSSAPVVFIVHNDDLLGRRGPGNAMAATGVLSACRTLGVEGLKAGIPANTVAVDDATDPATAARWIAQLLAGGPTGELIRIGGTHIGKALP
jgi:hypothetical protein